MEGWKVVAEEGDEDADEDAEDDAEEDAVEDRVDTLYDDFGGDADASDSLRDKSMALRRSFSSFLCIVLRFMTTGGQKKSSYTFRLLLR